MDRLEAKVDLGVHVSIDSVGTYRARKRVFNQLINRMVINKKLVSCYQAKMPKIKTKWLIQKSTKLINEGKSFSTLHLLNKEILAVCLQTVQPMLLWKISIVVVATCSLIYFPYFHKGSTIKQN